MTNKSSKGKKAKKLSGKSAKNKRGGIGINSYSPSKSISGAWRSIKRI